MDAEWEDDPNEPPGSQENDEDGGGGARSGKKKTSIPKSPRKGRGGGAGRGRGAGGRRSCGSQDSGAGGTKIKKKAGKFKKCFAAACEMSKAANSKFCHQHHRDAENMRYQAMQAKPSQLREVNAVLSDGSTGQAALDDWRKENPPDAGGRKQLIDWSQFTKRHGRNISNKESVPETLMTVADYWVYRGKPYGKTRSESDAAFNELKKTRIDRVGQGANVALWIPDLLRRSADTENFINSEQTEWSRVLKNPTQQEREFHRGTALSASGSHDDTFLRGAMAEPALRTPQKRKRDAADAEEAALADEGDGDGRSSGPGSGKKIAGAAPNSNSNTAGAAYVIVDDECAAQYGKHKKDWPSLTTSMKNSMSKIAGQHCGHSGGAGG